MYGICLAGVEHVAVVQVPDPEILHPSDAIVRVALAGLCGSDLHVYHGREAAPDPKTVLGHEFVGQIEAVGAAVKNLQPGDWVYCPFTTCCGECFYCQSGCPARCTQGELFGYRRDGHGLHGGQAQWTRVPLADSTLVQIPQGLDHRTALLLGDNLSTGVHAVELGQVDSHSACVIVGCGAVGLSAILACRQAGSRFVLAVEPVEPRAAQAERFGAAVASNMTDARRMIDQVTDRRGADVVVESVGSTAAQRAAYELVRPGGVLVAIGCLSAPHFAFSPTEAYDKNLTLRTGRCPARLYMQRLAPVYAQSWFDPGSLITHVFPLEHASEAYDVFARRQHGCIKAVFAVSGS